MAKGISLPVTQSGLEASIQQGVKNVGKVNIPVNIDPSAFKNLAQPLGRVSGLATEFEKSIAASNARVLAFGASVGIINGVQNAFADLVRTGIDVQKTLADIAAISGKGGKELSKFGDALFDVAKNTSQSFKTASQAALEFSRQGLSTEETLKRTNDALTLTRFTTLSAAEAVDVLTAAANSFSETGITTAQIINKLVAVDTKFAVSAEDLANGLARAGSIAQEVGVSFDELNAAVTITQERTARGGAVIGNALKTIFTRLRSNETVQALRDIGVESLNAQGGLKDAIPILQEVAAKIQDLGGGERVQILEAVASKYNINILSALLDDLNNANSKFGEAVAISAGANNQAYERQIELNKTLAAQINETTVSVTQLFNKLAEIGVTENLNSLLKFVNDLIGGFNKLLDSEGTGANIAKGIIKGLSDVFFTVGLPIIGAIFVKLTKDVAQFGVESLKTILGINQQVRERQALEQAVVNTLIRDQEVMATILALSGNRAKQEEYLLGIYNRQLAALQQVQSIASSVTPALMAGGLSATSGQIKKRGAGGYLPAQEAADIRRGVGGANSSARVVSIPNFAFGGGKRGTMIANTSEYIVPNFANGGSAIFNKDMVKAYGLPAGARKISAAGGYIPNFADLNSENKYAALVGKTSDQIQNRLQKRWVSQNAGQVNVTTTKPTGNSDLVSFEVYGVPSKSGEVIEKIKKDLSESGKNQAVAIAQSMTDSRLPSDLIQGKLAATFNPGSLSSFAGTIFEASVGSLLGDKSFDDYSEQAVTSAFDLHIAKNTGFKKNFGINPLVENLEIKGNDTKGLMDSVAKKIYQVASGRREAFSTGRVMIDAGLKQPKVARTFNKGGIDYVEYENNVFKPASGQDLSRYNPIANPALMRTAPIIRGAMGYIPNFAKGGPLEDAIQREMAAGLNPSQIRVTKDGRLRNSQNPNGLAVINTRDEPNGKIPNFASNTPGAIRKRENRAVASGRASLISDRPNQPTAASESSNQLEVGTGKLLMAFSGLTIATSTLQSTFKETETGIGAFVSKLTSTLAGASSGALLGNLGKEAIGNRGGAGMFGTLLRGAGKSLPFVGAAVGGALEVMDQIQATKAQEEKNKLLKDQENILRKIQEIEEQNFDNEEAAIAELAEKYAQMYEDRSMMEYELADLAASQMSAETYKRQSELQEERNSLLNQETVLFQQLVEKETQLERSKNRRAKAEKKEQEDLIKRVALTTQINALNEAAAKGEAAALEARTRRQNDIIKNSVFMTEMQKQQLADQEALLQIDDKRVDLRKSILLNTVKELSQGALVSVDQEKLNNLRQRLEAGEEIVDVEKELNNLGVKGNSEAAIKIKNAITDLRMKNLGLTTEDKTLKARQDANKEAKLALDLEKLRFETLNKTFESEKEMERLKISGVRALEEAQMRNPIAILENQIATQPFATREQEASLARLQAEFQKLSAQRRIDIDLADAQTKSFDDLQKSSISNIQSLSELGDSFTKENISLLQNSKNISQITDSLNELKKIRDVILERQFISEQIGENVVSKEDAIRLAAAQKGIAGLEQDIARYNLTVNQAKILAEEQAKSLQKVLEFRVQLANLKEKSPFQAGMFEAFNEINQEAYNFEQVFAKNTTLAFRDGMRDALSAAISQTDDLNGALQNVAMNFLKTMQNAFLQQASNSAMTGLKSVFGFAKGGLVTGGTGYRDDVPAMLTGGEFVMRKSAVQKYGAENLRKMNDGGIFLPGVRGGGAISGYDALRAFANQTTTSGATDILRGGRSSAFINLEDQSARLSRYALLGDDTINQEIRSAQEQGLNIIQQREAYRTQQRKAFQQQLVGTIASAALSYGIGKLASASKIPSSGPMALGSFTGSISGSTVKSLGPMSLGSFTSAFPRQAYGGMIRRYASGGPVDDVPALLMSGEYVMNRQSSSKYGKRLLDSMNQGRLPRFADGGEVGGSTTTTTESNAKMMGDVSININVSGQTSQTEAQGNTNVGGIDYKKMSERIKAVVIETINEEKRLGGSLRSR